MAVACDSIRVKAVVEPTRDPVQGSDGDLSCIRSRAVLELVREAGRCRTKFSEALAREGLLPGRGRVEVNVGSSPCAA